MTEGTAPVEGTPSKSGPRRRRSSISVHAYLSSIFKLATHKEIRKALPRLIALKPALLLPLSFAWLECKHLKGAELKATCQRGGNPPAWVFLLQDEEELKEISFLIKDRSAHSGLSHFSALFDQGGTVLHESCAPVYITTGSLRR